MRFLSASHRASYEASVIGSSPTWNRVYQMGQQVAPSPATVLLTGESGTGKEHMAGLVHRLSPRAKRPVDNAAAMPSTLLEAELCRYEKGACTGALHRKPGHVELADGGTVFLDESGAMPVDVQAKRLQVLQDGALCCPPRPPWRSANAKRCSRRSPRRRAIARPPLASYILGERPCIAC